LGNKNLVTLLNSYSKLLLGCWKSSLILIFSHFVLGMHLLIKCFHFRVKLEVCTVSAWSLHISKLWNIEILVVQQNYLHGKCKRWNLCFVILFRLKGCKGCIFHFERKHFDNSLNSWGIKCWFCQNQKFESQNGHQQAQKPNVAFF